MTNAKARRQILVTIKRQSSMFEADAARAGVFASYFWNFLLNLGELAERIEQEEKDDGESTARHLRQFH